MDLYDPLPPLFSISHYFRLVFKATSYISTELLYVGSSWSFCLCLSMWRGPPDYVTYEFVTTSPAVSYMSGSSNLDSFCDEWWMAIQLLLCGVLLPGLVQYCLQHSCVVAVERLPWPTLLMKSFLSLFNGISTLCRLFNAEAILLEEQ